MGATVSCRPFRVMPVRSPSFRLAVLLAAATFAAALAAVPATAQVVRGTVVDAVSGDGVAAAFVAILACAGGTRSSSGAAVFPA